MTQSFKEIYAWQKAHSFVKMVYKECASFPNYERFGLCSQFQRAAVSIPANIAEGYRKDGMADKAEISQYCSRQFRGMSLLYASFL